MYRLIALVFVSVMLNSCGYKVVKESENTTTPISTTQPVASKPPVVKDEVYSPEATKTAEAINKGWNNSAQKVCLRPFMSFDNLTEVPAYREKDGTQTIEFDEMKVSLPGNCTHIRTGVGKNSKTYEIFYPIFREG